MRTVHTKAPSFPEAALNQLLDVKPGLRWQVLCGDAGHWRLGIYSPPETRAEECRELERHDCPELFVLIEGELSLVVAFEDGVRTVPLERNRPILVTNPHSGFCPAGPHTGKALVIERDAFHTDYQLPEEWLRR